MVSLHINPQHFGVIDLLKHRDCVIKTYQREGIQRFFHGVGVNVIRMGPNTAVQFGSYEILKRLSDFF